MMDGQVIGNGTEQQGGLRNYQKETIDALRQIDSNEKPRFSTLVNLPTGAGKTEVIRRFCMEKLEAGNKVLFIADRIALLEQAISVFARYKCTCKKDGYSYQLICGDHGGSPNDDEGDDDEEKDINSKKEKVSKIKPETDILFASIGTIKGVATDEDTDKFDSLGKWLEESQKKGKRLYVVYDEAHHVGNNSLGAFLSAIFGCRDTYAKGVRNFYNLTEIGLIGLTATVYRGDKFIGSFNAWFKNGYDFKNNRIVYINSKYGNYVLDDIGKIRNNRIAPVDIMQLTEGYGGEEPVLADPDFIKVPDFMDGKPATEEMEMEYLAGRIKKHFPKLGKTAVIVRNETMAKTLCMELEKQGIPSIRFTSKGLSAGERKTVLKKFRNPECKDILVAISIFDEGIDVPDLNTIYLYAPTNSQVVLRQRVGRVLRQAKNKREEKRIIWQYYPKDCKT
ncbi:MAG TPA: hypothetical protein DDY31_06740, partial [Lachnospiraceae bacterium]|nr:hypothetical protein [Lachnospiraceae bacterium]